MIQCILSIRSLLCEGQNLVAEYNVQLITLHRVGEEGNCGHAKNDSLSPSSHSMHIYIMTQVLYSISCRHRSLQGYKLHVFILVMGSIWCRLTWGRFIGEAKLLRLLAAFFHFKIQFIIKMRVSPTAKDEAWSPENSSESKEDSA